MFNRAVMAFNAILLGMNLEQVLTGTADGFDYTFMGIQIVLVFLMILLRNVWEMDY